MSSSSPRRWHHDFTLLARESFTFQQSSTTSSAFCDWKAIEPVDVDEIISNRDVECIERLLPSLTNAPIGSLVHNKILDPNLRKYLRLAQLGLQYLLFCKKFLEKTLCGLRLTVEETSRDSSKLAKILKKKNEEISQLQERIKAMEATQAQIIYSCNKCLRRFTKPEALDDHLRLDHVSDDVRTAPPPMDNNLINAIKLELEVKQLKERLNAAEKELQNQKSRQTEPVPHNFSRTVDKGIETHHFQDAYCQTDSECDFTESVANAKEHVPEIKEQESPALSPPTIIDVPESTYIQRLDQALQEQMKLIETWRQNDRNMYREEINELQKCLKEVVTSLDLVKAAKPVDDPNSDKSHGSNRSLQLVQRSVPMKPKRMDKSDDVTESPTPSPWEEKFHNLEKLFIERQEEMQQNLQNLNSAYNEKLQTLERRLKETSTPQPKIRKVQPYQLHESVQEPSTQLFKEPIQVITQDEEDSEPYDDDDEEEVVIKSIERQDSNKIRKRGAHGGNITGSSFSRSPKTSFKAIKERRPLKPKLPVKLQDSSTSDVSTRPQVGGRQHLVVQKKPSSPIMNLFTRFKDKLFGYGIRDTDRGLSTNQMLAVKSQLAADRLKIKKENKYFTSVRAKLNNKANTLSKQRLEAIQLTKLALTSPEEEEQKDWRQKLSEKIDEETEDSDDTNVSTDFTSPPVNKIETKAEINSNIVHVQPSRLTSSRMSYPNFETVKFNKPKLNSSHGTGDEGSASSGGARFDAALKKILESPVRRPSLPVKFNTLQIGTSSNKRQEEIKPKKVPLKKVIFSDDLSKTPLDEPLKTKQNNFDMSIESFNESDEIQSLK